MEFAALGLAFGLVILNGFFVAIEFALVKVRPTQLERLVEQGSGSAEIALKMRQRLDTWLSASQVGITLASLALGWVGEPAFSHLIEPLVIKVLPESFETRGISKTIGIVLAFGVITFLHIVIGEQVPKTLAIRNSESTSMALAWPMRVFYVVFFPVIWVLNKGTKLTLKALRLEESHDEGSEVLHEDELKLIFSRSAQAGAIAHSRAQLLERALSMVEKTARQVLVPRTQMKYLDLESTLEENLQEARLAGHTWMPVVRGGLDQVEGLVNVKDLLFLLSRGELKSLSQVQRPVLFVPESITLEQLLAEFRRRSKQVAVVVDEHGGTSGMVTISDVVAELVGKVAELGRKVDPVKSLPGGKLELPGTAQLDDLEHTLEIEFEVDKTEVTTIAGYLMSRLGRVPKENDFVVRDDYRIQAVKVEGPRVVTVRIEPHVAGAPMSSSTSNPNLNPVK